MFGNTSYGIIDLHVLENKSLTNSSGYNNDSDIVACLPRPLLYFFGILGALAKLFAAYFNFAIVYTFFKVRRLITPFTIHVLNLIIIDLSSVVTLGPMLMYREFDPSFLHYAPLCAWFQYFIWIISALLVLQHTIICADRWMAIYAPLLYRGKRVYHGVAATFFVIVHFHAWFLPVFVQDDVWNSKEGEGTGQWLSRLCDFPRPRPYLFLAITMIFWVPEVFVYVSYPLIVRHVLNRQRKTAAAKAGARSRVRFSTTTVVSQISRAERTTEGSSFGSRNTSGINHDGRSEPRRKRQEGESANKLVIVALAIQFCLWLPVTLLITFKGIRPELPCTTDLYGFAYPLGVIVLLADPFIYLAFLPDLKREVSKLFPLLNFDRWVCGKVKVDTSDH